MKYKKVWLLKCAQSSDKGGASDGSGDGIGDGGGWLWGSGRPGHPPSQLFDPRQESHTDVPAFQSLQIR